MTLAAFSLLAILLLNATGGAASSTAKTGSVVLPDGLPDGHYKFDGTTDPKTGYSKYIYLGPIDHAVANHTARAAAGLVRRATVTCSNRNAGDSVSAVENAFFSFWNGQTVTAGEHFSTTQGTSRA